MWKLIVWLATVKKTSRCQMVKVRGKCYVMEVYEYISAEQQTKMMEDALGRDLQDVFPDIRD